MDLNILGKFVKGSTTLAYHPLRGPEGSLVRYQHFTGGLSSEIDKLKKYMGKYPDAAVQTKIVNKAFHKAAQKYATGIRGAYRRNVRSRSVLRPEKRTGALYGAITSKPGKYQHRPSAMLFAGGGPGAYHRWLIENDIHNKDGSVRRKGTPYVEPGMKEANGKARVALSEWIRKHQAQIVAEANRIAERG